MKNYEARTYYADAGRGTGREKVICILLTLPDDVLSKKNSVAAALVESGMSKKVGVYFYRLRAKTHAPERTR